MNYLHDIRALLFKMQRSYGHERAVCIGQLQDMIWNDTTTAYEGLNDMLSDLAGDLNFYEPEERDRDESLGYYGDEKFDQLIDATIRKLDNFLSR